jgi:hypothetical protein
VNVHRVVHRGRVDILPFLDRVQAYARLDSLMIEFAEAYEIDILGALAYLRPIEQYDMLGLGCCRRVCPSSETRFGASRRGDRS